MTVREWFRKSRGASVERGGFPVPVHWILGTGHAEAPYAFYHVYTVWDVQTVLDHSIELELLFAFQDPRMLARGPSDVTH